MDYAQVTRNRMEFMELYRELFDDGILRETYRAKKGSLYAVSDSYFAVIPFTDVLPEQAYLILLCNDTEAKEYVRNEDFFLRMLENKKQNNRLTFLTKNTKEVLYKQYAKASQDPEKAQWMRDLEATVLAAREEPSPSPEKPEKRKSSLLVSISAGLDWLGLKWKQRKPKPDSQTPDAAAAGQEPAATVSKPETTVQKPATAAQENEKKAREEMNAAYQAFLETEGALPQGFSAPYVENTSGYFYQGTPFDAYVDEITRNADKVKDDTGISDWLHLDVPMEINLAAAEITNWVLRYREMHAQLWEKCTSGDTRISPPLFTYCRENVMVILDDASLFQGISEKSLEDCKAAGVSFCTILSDRKLYDLMEQKEKGVRAVSYPNYHDETYADVYFIDQTSYDWRYL